MKQQGGLETETTHYDGFNSTLMAPASTLYQDDYNATCDPEHIHAANKRKLEF
jgi:hypothetical protein